MLTYCLFNYTSTKVDSGGDNCLNNGFFGNNEIENDCLSVLFHAYTVNVRRIIFGMCDIWQNMLLQ